MVELLRRKFSVAEYQQMSEVGIFSEDDRIELISGEIVNMSPIGQRHAACVNRLVRIFTTLLGNRMILSVQNPIRLNDNSQPQPDLVLLKNRDDFYEGKVPESEDIFLLVEVADTSFDYDQEIKVPLYGASGIPEVWLVNLNLDCLWVYREGNLDNYQNIKQLFRGENVRVQSFPEINIEVNKILGNG